ncbi:G protein-coupled receptor gpr1 [Diaporthe eres]|uniref:G protein-coupled receptor gpr1 n=1 Tax=Diaporthe eres TaxID=83184 RepID=A0ABR1PDQ8_DIAER
MEIGYRLQPPRASLSTIKLGGRVENLPTRKSPSRCRISSDFYRRPISTSMEEEEILKGQSLNVGRSRHLNGSQMHIYTVLQQGPSSEREGEPTPGTPIASLGYETLESEGISRGRDRIRPSLVSLCVQGLADTVVFCVREKPWRHTKGGFWENLGSFMNGLSFESRNEIGKTREEMFHDGSRARLRREEEMEREQRAIRMSPGCTPQVSVSRNWWDIELHGDDEVDSRDGQSKDGEWQMRGDRGNMQTG